MKNITFTVTNDLPEDMQTTNHVLVFLKPYRTSPNYQFYAWKDLNPASGNNQPFEFLIDISVEIFDPKTQEVTPRVAINPGQCFTAVNPNTQGPTLNLADVGGVTPSQVGIVNGCGVPDTAIGVTWYNAGSKVVTIGAAPNDIINVGKTITFELEPTLYFMAADPTIVGPNFTLQDYSNATAYKLDPSISNVHVLWTRSSAAGQDRFIFDPASK